MLFAQFATVGVASFGCHMVLNGQLSVGGLGACTMLVGRTMQPLLGGVALWSRLQSLAESRRRVAEIGALPQERRAGRHVLQVREGHIVLENVRFQEPALCRVAVRWTGARGEAGRDHRYHRPQRFRTLGTAAADRRRSAGK